MDEILERVNRVESQISLIKNKVAYRDLRQMLSSVDKVVTEISKESVECRRMKKTTSKYTELTEQADMLLTNLEQHITFAALIK
jgi:5-methylcytosine-specific restriction endonuclease McrBC regulatory subunit McrC